MTDDPIGRIIKLAKSQVGYREGPRNKTKYPPEVKGLEWAQNQPWCATFCAWLAEKTNLVKYYPRTASVVAAEKWGRDRGQWSEYPAVGALVIIGNRAHIGIVTGYDRDYVYTVEGNTNNNGSANGDGVYARKRLRRSAGVRGYVYPNIPGVALKSADPNYKPPADTNSGVKMHKVESGETITDIAKKYNHSVEYIVQVNRLIFPGKVLKVGRK